MNRTAVLSIAAVILLCSCGSAPKKPLVEEWAVQFEKYNMHAVFPPREDIQVGDIYLLCFGRQPGSKDGASAISGPNWSGLSVFLTQLPAVPSALNAFYRSRLPLPETPLKEGGNTSAKAAGRLPTTADLFVTDKGATNRLRAVSLPEFFSVTASGFDAGVTIPLPSFLLGAGIAREDVESVTVSVPAAEGYGLPLFSVEDALQGFKDRQRIENIAFDANAAGRPYCTGGRATAVLVTQVIYARAIDVQLNLSSRAAARVNAALAVPEASKRAAVWDALSKYFASGDDAHKAGSTKEGPKDQGVKSTSPAAQFLQYLTELVSKTEGLTKRDYPGVTVGGYWGTGSGVSMSREFVNPVAIGYRGLELLDEDGKWRPRLLGLGSVGTLLKEPTPENQ